MQVARWAYTPGFAPGSHHVAPYNGACQKHYNRSVKAAGLCLGAQYQNGREPRYVLGPLQAVGHAPIATSTSNLGRRSAGAPGASSSTRRAALMSRTSRSARRACRHEEHADSLEAFVYVAARVRGHDDLPVRLLDVDAHHLNVAASSGPGSQPPYRESSTSTCNSVTRASRSSLVSRAVVPALSAVPICIASAVFRLYCARNLAASSPTGAETGRVVSPGVRRRARRYSWASVTLVAVPRLRAA